MVFLTNFLKKIGGYLLPIGLDWLWGKISIFVESYKKKKDIEDKNKDVREGLEKGETPEERDRAAEDVAKRFGD